MTGLISLCQRQTQNKSRLCLEPHGSQPNYEGAQSTRNLHFLWFPEEVKPHVECTNSFPSFARFERVLALFWANNGYLGLTTAQVWQGTSRLGACAPGRHRWVFGSKLGFGKATTWDLDRLEYSGARTVGTEQWPKRK